MLTRAHTHVFYCTHLHIFAHVHNYYEYVLGLVCVTSHTHSQRYTHIHTHTYITTYAHTCAHTCILLHAPAYLCTCTLLLHVCNCACVCDISHTYTEVHTHTHTHIHTHTYTEVHTHTYIHTHICRSASLWSAIWRTGMSSFSIANPLCIVSPSWPSGSSATCCVLGMQRIL